MNHHPVPKRASLGLIESQRRTTQNYPLQRQATSQRRTTTPHQNISADVWDEEEDQSERDTRTARFPNSAHYTPTQRELVPLQSSKQRSPFLPRKHPLLYMGLGMLGTLGLAALLLGPVGSWWQDMNDTRLYGYPRTYQTDAVVGHNDSVSHPSHFIALNLHDQIIVIEFPGDDLSKGRDFLISTTIGPNADLYPVTLTFTDVNGDGKPDMIIQVERQHIVYINDHGTFRPARPGEVLNLNG